MKITYLYHSCFYVELEHHILLFDYYKGVLPSFDPTKALYVFVSHGHEDHYQLAIFSIVHPHCTYILSSDILVKRQDNISIMNAHEQHNVEDIKVETLASTDLGVAFLVEVEGKCIYHAGDLNWWDWGEADTLEESKMMEDAYTQEIGRIKKTIDIAFVPVDLRLDKSYDKGLIYFMEHTSTKYIFPMHFGNEIEAVEKIRGNALCSAYKNKIMKITHTNEEFCIIL